MRGRRARDLQEAGIGSVTDLLFHIPRRYLDRSRKVPLGEVPEGDDVTVMGVIGAVNTRRPRRNLVIVEAVVADETGSLKAVWFNQFRPRQLQRGSEVILSGRTERFRGRLQMNSPALDVLGEGPESLETGRVVPVYRAVGSAGPGDLRKGIFEALRRSRPIPDPVPADIRSRCRLPGRDQALVDVHFPETTADAYRARRRLAFDEFFRLEAALAMAKQRNAAEETGIVHEANPPLVRRFLEGLPFQLTGAQQRVIGEIGEDMSRPHPMHRLLQGEVGSGKTAAATAAALTAVAGGYQAAVMAPTEVLAGQHFRGVRDLIADAGMAPNPDLFSQDQGQAGKGPGGEGIRAALLTGEESETNFRPPGSVARAEMLKLIQEGEAHIVFGTHALISAGVRFHRLGAAVVDEQHRFGVRQRVRLREKAGEEAPDMLIMTATPIPRTLAMTLYGDLDVSTLDEMPPGRSPIRTWATDNSPEGLRRVYEAIREEAGRGGQAFMVCPRVEDTDKSEAASAEAEYRRLQADLPDLRLGLLHGRMRAADKDRVMAEFRSGARDVLVATTVIEVGIDVPNAAVMVIRDADRFGLSQLHQLRGRVGRGARPSQCVLMAEPTTEEGAARIQAMLDTDDGFVLAEKDLELRQPGTVFGSRQSGMSDLKAANILRDVKELAQARREAFALVERDPKLEESPELREEVRALLGDDVEWLFAS